LGRKRQKTQTELFVGGAIARNWSRLEAMDEHQRVMPLCEDQKPRLHISRVTASIWPTIDDDFNRLPRALESLAER
jgi:hypothetical protein